MEPSSAFKDPVCGMTVTPRSFYFLDQGDQRHYFCGARCKARFGVQLRHAHAQSPQAQPSQQAQRPWLAAPALHRLPLQQRWMLPLALVSGLVLAGWWLL